jgi:hypothetical protein
LWTPWWAPGEGGVAAGEETKSEEWNYGIQRLARAPPRVGRRESGAVKRARPSLVVLFINCSTYFDALAFPRLTAHLAPFPTGPAAQRTPATFCNIPHITPPCFPSPAPSVYALCDAPGGPAGWASGWTSRRRPRRWQGGAGTPDSAHSSSPSPSAAPASRTPAVHTHTHGSRRPAVSCRHHVVHHVASKVNSTRLLLACS